jgi:hypothetical protein
MDRMLLAGSPVLEKVQLTPFSEPWEKRTSPLCISFQVRVSFVFRL